MKMKRILGMALSAVLAFGLAFGVAPAKVAEATPVSGVVSQDGVIYIENATAGDVTVSGTTVTISGLTATGNVSLWGSGYTYVFEGTNVINDGGHSFVIDESCTINMADGATLTANNLGIEDVSYGNRTKIVLSLADGVVASYQSSTVKNSSTYETISTGGAGTLSGNISSENGQSYHYATVVFSKNNGASSETTTSDDSSSDSSSGGSSSSGSSSGGSSSGGSSMSAAQIMAIAQAATGGTTTTASTPVEAAKATPDMSANSSIDKATVETSANGTAKISNIKSESKSIEIDSTVEVNGVSYKVKTLGKGALKSCDEVKTVTVPASVNKFEEGAFTGADNLKTVKINTKKAVKVEKGAFDGLNTSKMTIRVSKKMSDKEFAKLQKNLTKAGYKGKVTRSL